MPLTQQSGFSFPMFQQGPQGHLRYTSQDTVSLINFSILQILLTVPGERLWNPLFGCLLKKMIFENLSATTISTAKSIIMIALQTWETRITVTADNITFSLVAGATGGTKTKIQISYTVINPDFTASRQKTSVTVII